MNRTSLSVTGMSCDGCERTVENALTNLDGVTRVTANHETDTVKIVVEDGVADDVRATVESAGYDVVD